MAEHRLFIAFPIPEHISDVLLDVQEGVEAARWQDADNLHITLRFIGEVSRHMADDICAALSSLAFAPIPLTITGVGHFEKKGRAHTIWAGVEPSAALLNFQARIEQACQRAGLPAETRKYSPHVTLARLNASSGAIGPWVARHSTLSGGQWQAQGFALYQSDLTTNGAIYSQIAHFPVR